MDEIARGRVEPVSAAAPVGLLVGGALGRGAARLQVAVLMVEKGEDDAIHQVRVSCRRLRSDLKLFRKLLAGHWAADLRGDLAALAQACGETRDLEVIADLIRETATSEDNQEHIDTVLTTLTVALDRSAVRSAEVVLGEATTELLKTLQAVAAAPDLKSTASQPCGDVLPELLEDARRTFAQGAGKLEPWTPDEDWHEVRLLAKRLRYAADTSATVLGEQAQATASEAAKYQTLLGRHQDHCTAADALTAMAADAAAQDDPELSFTLGRLTERQRAARKPLREKFLSLYHRP
jgi:CHAD domain-containing protein